MSLSFEVLHDGWVADGQEFSANDNPHEIVKPSENLARAATAAHHAGALNVTEGLLEGVVQSQEDGEAAYAAAQGEWVEPEIQPDGTRKPGYWTGPWGEANIAQAALDAIGKSTATTFIEVTGPEETQEEVEE